MGAADQNRTAHHVPVVFANKNGHQVLSFREQERLNGHHVLSFCDHYHTLTR